ncbi:alkaline-phosphatase-like protein [Phyllosticta paracitricarpa]
MPRSSRKKEERRKREDVEDTQPMLANSDSDTAYEGEEEDAYEEKDRTSTEVRREDLELLHEEDERENLIASSNSTSQGGFQQLFRSDRERRKSRRDGARGRRPGSGEDSRLMEEGGRLSSSSSRESSEVDKHRVRDVRERRKKSLSSRWIRPLLYVAVAVLFLVLFLFAYRISGFRPTKHYEGQLMRWNGTSHFAPTTILISLDGFRADFLQRKLTPTLQSFIDSGISPQYMLPSFPSVTFPNHYTMVTGLYPESHGIVGNTFWDPKLQEEFYYTNTAVSMQSKWWGGDPIWATAEAQGIRTAIHMWPGSEAKVGEFQAAHIDKYNGSEVLSVKVDRMLQFLDLPGPESERAAPDQPRPQLIAAYVPVVDSDGHKYGPNSTEIRQTITDVDTMLAGLLSGLEERNLTEIVNVVIVSDHGMATTDVSRLIQFEDLVDPSLIEHIDGWPLYGLRPKNPDAVESIYDQLKYKAKHNPNIEVYLKDKDMPERYHFHQNDRIAPLWIVPKAGWAIVTKEEFDIEEGLRTGAQYEPKGLHGYDHEHPLMRAIFVARGPAFPHAPGSRLEPFQNIELYNIICDTIGAEPKPNNGTLRLPLKPVGLHSDTPSQESSDDPPKSVSSTPTPPQTPPPVPLQGSKTVAIAGLATPIIAIHTDPAEPKVSEPDLEVVEVGSGVAIETPAGGQGATDHQLNGDVGGEEVKEGDEGKEKAGGLWAWLADKINKAKAWAISKAHKVGDGMSQAKEQIEGKIQQIQGDQERQRTSKGNIEVEEIKPDADQGGPRA